MANEEEWRQKAYEEGVGRQGNNSMGTQANNKGYQDHLDYQKRNSGGGGGNGGCFPKGTLVSTPSGKKDITTLRKGQLISGVNPLTGDIEPRKILKICSHAPCSIWELEFEGGKRIRTTSIHSFLISKGWERASRILPSDEILVIDTQGQIQKSFVVSSNQTNVTENVYNLIVDDDFTFIADGAVVHSFTYFRNFRVAYWQTARFLFKFLSIYKPIVYS